MPASHNEFDNVAQNSIEPAPDVQTLTRLVDNLQELIGWQASVIGKLSSELRKLTKDAGGSDS